MILQRVVLENWMRYAGRVQVDLGAGVFGVVAQYADDPRRSNWAGKTAVLEAVRFALYGVHRFDREDAWITHGESEGSVQVELTGGIVVHRSRKRGSPTRLSVKVDGTEATGPAAQLVLNERLGLDAAAFGQTCWFGQRGFAGFVLDTPAARMERVESWLRLERVQDALERARDTLRGRLQDEARYEAQLAALRTDKPADLEAARQQQQAAKQLSDDAEAALTLAIEQNNLQAQAQQALSLQQDFDNLVARGKQEASELQRLEAVYAGLPDVRPQYDEARAALGLLEGELNRRLAVARGGFDGKCPVMCDDCPAAGHVEAAVTANAEQLQQGRAEARQAREALQVLLSQIEARDAAGAAVAQSRQHLSSLRAQAVGLKKRLGEIPQAPQSVPDLASARAAAKQALLQSQQADSWVAQVEERQAKQAELQAWLTARQAQRREAAVVVEIFRVSLRKIAEAALADIEADANAILAAAGIQLTVSVQWQRTGQGLATHCTACGQALPTSAKVKQCPACKAERGPKQVERLDLQLSDTSGAAEDLAGAALQLAAWDWVRRDRNVGWGVAFLDEPFGALDGANRRGFATALQVMLTQRFQQAFVVAHHDDVTDALERRLTVKADEYGSALEVS